MTEVFADYLNITTPKDNAAQMMASIKPILDSVGLYADTEGLYRLPGGGTFKTSSRGAVYILSASGQVLARMRAMALLVPYLMAVYEGGPYRVSLLHATADMPFPAPKIVRRLYAKAVKGGLYLSRKAIKPSNVSKYFRQNPEGEETGTVYLGRRTSEVWAKVYDKRNETIDRGGDDPGPLLRIELAVTGKQGVTLKDVEKPAPVFYHYAAPALCVAPPDVSPWEPFLDGGFKLDKRPTLLPAQRLKRRLDNSRDLTELLQLAEQIGPHGLTYLLRQIELRYHQLHAPALGDAGPAHGPTDLH